MTSERIDISDQKNMQSLMEGEVIALYRNLRDHIDQSNARINSFLHVPDKFDFSNLDLRSHLSSMPIAVKDNIAVKSMPLTCGSKLLENHYPTSDSTAVRRLRKNGGIIVGKTNMDEFGMGSSTEYSGFYPTKNPWNEMYVPGGSSGGSAAAVASGQAIAALGSDTGGSVRQPAGFCGVVGFKPSYGSISRHGLVAYGSSLDQIGVLAHKVSTVEQIFSDIYGPDSIDWTVVTKGQLASKRDQTQKVTVGVLEGYEDESGIDNVVIGALKKAINILEENGVNIIKISFADIQHLIVPTYYLTACAEASSNLNRYDGVHFGTRINDNPINLDEVVNSSRTLLGAEVKMRILLGTYILRSGFSEKYYKKAQAVRKKLINFFNNLFLNVDYILTPTFPSLAFKFEEMLGDPVKMKAADIYTLTANIIGAPAISVPIEIVGGLPTSVQLMGNRYSDFNLLDFAKSMESELKFPLGACPLFKSEFSIH